MPAAGTRAGMAAPPRPSAFSAFSSVQMRKGSTAPPHKPRSYLVVCLRRSLHVSEILHVMHTEDGVSVTAANRWADVTPAPADPESRAGVSPTHPAL